MLDILGRKLTFFSTVFLPFFLLVGILSPSSHLYYLSDHPWHLQCQLNGYSNFIPHNYTSHPLVRESVPPVGLQEFPTNISALSCSGSWEGCLRQTEWEALIGLSMFESTSGNESTHAMLTRAEHSGIGVLLEKRY